MDKYLLSANGSVVIGGSKSDFQSGRACRWTENGQNVKTLSEEPVYLHLHDLSYDGSAVVGCEGEARDRKAFLWTLEEGKQLVQDLLAQKGKLPPGWTLTDAIKITPDGRVLAGMGDYRAAPGATPQRRAWRIFLGAKNLF